MKARLSHLVIAALLCASNVFAQGGPASVAVSVVQSKELASGQTYVGTVLPSKYSSVGAAVDGRMDEIHVNEGDFVQKRKPLAKLLTETIKLERDAAAAELDLRRYELAELENGARPEELGEAKAKMMAAKAFREFRLAQRHRNEQLFKDGAIGDDALHEIQAEADAAEQLHKQAKEIFKMVTAGPRVEKILQAQARVAMHEAMVRNLEARISKHTIIAPFDGYVVARPSEVGEWIKQGDLVADIVALDYVDVLLNVLEKHITHVARGMDEDMDISVEIPALPDQLLTGQVVLIVPQADVRARTFPVKVRIKNTILPSDPLIKSGIKKTLLPSGPLIKSGMLARATLPTGPERETLLVPKDALVLGGATPVVYVVNAPGKGQSAGAARKAESVPSPKPSGKVRRVSVRLGVSHGLLIGVHGDIYAGDRVVVRGNERLRPGQDVIIIETLDPDAEPQAKATGQ
jgi:RND family efflux transporter MFP subunit